ncbi:MAG: heme biosynthesis HemY N-terminal domain-containing protein [Hyphomicrobium sp.]|nr:heme biosynthesis HemY N-terminal domain-containing protein [Hyphomicrobium sp.]
MLRLVLFLLAVLGLAAGLAWLADRPGSVVVNWEGYDIQTNVFVVVVAAVALVGFALFIWSLGRILLSSPAQLGHFLTRRRQRLGLDALSSGMIAIGAGDRSSATRYAVQARKSLPNEPLTHLLRAQAAQLSGDRATARRIFEAMLASPDTEQLGLRGLYLEALREGEAEAARQFAERATRLNPRLGWPLDALYDAQIKARDWAGANETVLQAKRIGHLDKAIADRRRAVLLTAEAQALEDNNADKALAYASEAHALAPDLVPAAAIAGRILAARGHTAKAAKILQKTWMKSPHPDLAAAYAYARIGDSPRDRLDRIKQLAALKPHDLESSIAVAHAAFDAKLYDDARHALQPILGDRLTRRAARLMARIEQEDKGDAGRVREWVARASTAARDKVWMADGIVADDWAPVSPKSGTLDAFQWAQPGEALIAGHAVENEPVLPPAYGALPGQAVPKRADADEPETPDRRANGVGDGVMGEVPYRHAPDDPGPDDVAEIDRGTPVIRSGPPPQTRTGPG